MTELTGNPSATETAAGDQVVLDPADFWKLRALIRDAQLLEADWARVQIDSQQRIRGAIDRRDQFFAQLALKYPALKNRQFRTIDETCSLAVHNGDSPPTRPE